MKVVSVLGARPQFVKLAPIAEALDRAGVEHIIVHTGQHYDTNMSEVFFADLSIPPPDVNLNVGSATHGVQTGRMLAALDPLLDRLSPDWVLVYGDTNSTLAAALSAAKQHIPVAHLEAGLRSFNREMPEEHNRVLTDHASDLLLAPTRAAMAHLEAENLAARAVHVGDVMADVCLRVAQTTAEAPLPLPHLRLKAGDYCVATVHRAENTDDAARLTSVIGALQRLPVPVVLLAHPRLRTRASIAGINLSGGAVRLADPQPYPQTIKLIANAASILTDSGGLQKESYLLGIPCVTLRRETEWSETLEGGWNVLQPDLEDLDTLVSRTPTSEREAHFGDGFAARKTVDSLLNAKHRR